MIELYNALKIITLLFFIHKILTFNLGVAFLKSVSIVYIYLLRYNGAIGKNVITQWTTSIYHHQISLDLFQPICLLSI